MNDFTNLRSEVRSTERVNMNSNPSNLNNNNIVLNQIPSNPNTGNNLNQTINNSNSNEKPKLWHEILTHVLCCCCCCPCYSVYLLHVLINGGDDLTFKNPQVIPINSNVNPNPNQMLNQQPNQVNIIIPEVTQLFSPYTVPQNRDLLVSSNKSDNHPAAESKDKRNSVSLAGGNNLKLNIAGLGATEENEIANNLSSGRKRHSHIDTLNVNNSLAKTKKKEDLEAKDEANHNNSSSHKLDAALNSIVYNEDKDKEKKLKVISEEHEEGNKALNTNNNADGADKQNQIVSNGNQENQKNENIDDMLFNDL